MSTTNTTTATTAVTTRPTAGRASIRTARQLARERSAARTVDRKRARELATSRGWELLSADNVADMLTAGESIGREFLGSDSAEIATAGLDRVSRWLGGLADSADTVAVLARLATSRGAGGYAARLARLAARQYAARHGTGRGSMPRLVLSDDELDARLADIYGARSHSVAVATAARVDSAELDQLELGERVAAAQWAAVLVDTPAAYRSISESELGQLRLVSRFERTPAAPMFSRWLDQYGDSVPTAGSAHTFAHLAPGLPERDVGPLRRGSLRERLTALGVDSATTSAAVLALDSVNTRKVSRDGARVGRYPRRVYWSRIAAEIGAGEIVPATLARRVGAALDLLGETELGGAELFSDDSAVSYGARVAAVGTGRVIGRGTYDDSAVSYSVSPAVRSPRLDRDVLTYGVAAGLVPYLTAARILAITAGEYSDTFRANYGEIPRGA